MGLDYVRQVGSVLPLQLRDLVKPPTNPLQALWIELDSPRVLTQMTSRLNYLLICRLQEFASRVKRRIQTQQPSQRLQRPRKLVR